MSLPRRKNVTYLIFARFLIFNFIFIRKLLGIFNRKFNQFFSRINQQTFVHKLQSCSRKTSNRSCQFRSHGMGLGSFVWGTTNIGSCGNRKRTFSLQMPVVESHSVNIIRKERYCLIFRSETTFLPGAMFAGIPY